MSWESRRQPSVTRSTTEAEYIAAGEALQEALFLNKLLRNFSDSYVTLPIPISCDNQSAIALANGESVNKRTRHIATREHAVKEQSNRGTIKMEYVPTGSNLADVLTKGVTPAVLSYFTANVLSVSCTAGRPAQD